MEEDNKQEKKFIGFQELADELEVDSRMLKKTILRNRILKKQLEEAGFAIKKNHLSARLLTKKQATLIRKGVLGDE